MTNPISFVVSSGAICFGSLAGILRASRLPVQTPPNPRPYMGGTVEVHDIQHNMPSQNGAWNAYALTSTDDPARVDAWFAAHEGVDPLPELRKLLRVAGSPYEYEHGSRTNSETTRDEGVLLVNRYDWGWGIPEQDEISEEEDDDFMSRHNTIGLVDYAHAATQLQDWSLRASSQRGGSEHGVWMHVPRPEYMWARLGFNDEYTHARSLLFFTQRTDFFRTRFPGETEPLRKFETELERFRRGLREGRDYSGIAMLREWYTPPPAEMQPPGTQFTPSRPPPETELLGPYLKGEYILSPEDIEALREGVQPMNSVSVPTLSQRVISDAETERRRKRMKTAVFAGPYKEEIYDLFNELIMSYLEHFVLLLGSHTTARTLGPALFPKLGRVHSRDSRTFDNIMLSVFSKVGKYPSNFDIAAVAERIQVFLKGLAGENAVAFDGECLVGLARIAAYIVMEVIEVASQSALGRSDSEDECIMVPETVRQTVYLDEEILNIVQYSSVF